MHRYTRVRPLWIGVLVSIWTLSACSSSKPVVTEDPVEVPVDLVETFDPAPFADTPPPDGIEITHDVPESLMDGSQFTTSTRTPRRMPGYRIQVYSSQDRQLADKALERAIVWWESLPEHEGSQAPVYLEYEQPRYKVRVGNYGSRDEANQLLYPVREMFPSAFIVPTMIMR